MQFARRVQELPPYLFAEISRKIAAKRAEGVQVVSFGIGDPDLPTPPHVIEALKQASDVPANHRYPETEGLPELREAMATWYERRFGVGFDCLLGHERLNERRRRNAQRQLGFRLELEQ